MTEVPPTAGPHLLFLLLLLLLLLLLEHRPGPSPFLLLLGLCALGQAQVAVQPQQISGMLGGQAVAAVAVHMVRLLNDNLVTFRALGWGHFMLYGQQLGGWGGNIGLPLTPLAQLLFLPGQFDAIYIYKETNKKRIYCWGPPKPALFTSLIWPEPQFG